MSAFFRELNNVINYTTISKLITIIKLITNCWSCLINLKLHNLYFFTICMYKHCFLPLLHIFVMNCLVFKCSGIGLITLIAARFLHLCACFTCSSVHLHASTVHIACSPLSVYFDVFCVSVFFVILCFFLSITQQFCVIVTVIEISWFCVIVIC